MPDVASDERTLELIKIKSAVAWRPAPGDTVSGTIVRVLRRETNSEFGAYPLVVMDTGEAQYTAVHAFHTILRDQLREIKAGPGDQITIVYQGKIESKNDAPERDDQGNPRKRKYHAYILIVNGVDLSEDYTWDGAADESDDTPGY